MWPHALHFYRLYTFFDTCSDKRRKVDLTTTYQGKTVWITGASSGIGKGMSATALICSLSLFPTGFLSLILHFPLELPFCDYFTQLLLN